MQSVTALGSASAWTEAATLPAVRTWAAPLAASQAATRSRSARSSSTTRKYRFCKVVEGLIGTLFPPAGHRRPHHHNQQPEIRARKEVALPPANGLFWRQF